MLNNHRPVRVAVLCSHDAPGLMYLLNTSPERGVAFEIVCCLTSERTFAEEVRVERRGIPTIAHPIADFFEARGTSMYRDQAGREVYDRETLALVEPYLPDILLLDGYLYLLTAPLLARFLHRVINLHFSDLAQGCRVTRATVHLVNEVPDSGAPIVLSWPFPVSPLVEELRTQNAADVFNAYAFAHQQWMMRTASGPLIASALHLIATRVVDLDTLASADVRSEIPRLLDRHGFLMAPEVEFA